jgi:hypothetical protein
MFTLALKARPPVKEEEEEEEVLTFCVKHKSSAEDGTSVNSGGSR